MIDLKNVWKAFGPIRVLEDLSLSVERGEFISVRGESGVGKTTLIKIAGLTESPDSGEVLFSGRDIWNMGDGSRSDLRLRKIGFVFQFHNLIPTITVIENVELPMYLKGVGGERRREKARKLLSYFDLEGYEDRDPDSLSGGERQRIAAARALVNDPDIVLADEPTASLDEENTRLIIDMLKKVNSKGTAIVLTTTDLHADLPTDVDYVMRSGNLEVMD